MGSVGLVVKGEKCLRVAEEERKVEDDERVKSVAAICFFFWMG